MKPTTKAQRQSLTRRYHTLCTRLGMKRENRDALLLPYGVSSSLDLSLNELQEVCDKLENISNPGRNNADKWRKRVMASIGAWLRATNQEQNAKRIMGIACRASGYSNFNEIPLDRLRNLYYSFLNKQKDFNQVTKVTNEEIEMLTSCN